MVNPVNASCSSICNLYEAMNMLKENEENYNFHLKQMAVEHEELETELEYTKNDLDQLKNHL